MVTTRFNNRYFSFLWLLLFSSIYSQTVFSAEFYWYRTSSTAKFASPQAACDYFGRNTSPLSWRPSDTYVSKVATMRPDGTAQCRIASQPSDTNIDTFSLYKSGECSGSYNSAIGICTPPPEPEPEPEPQDCSNLSPGIFKSPSGPIINSGGRNYIATGFPPGSSVCFGGCSYSIGSAASSCYKDIGSTTAGYCNYVGTGTGETCTEPDAALGAPGDALNPPDTPDVPPSDPNDPCHGLPGYSWSGTTCVKDPDNTNPGGDTGGDTGGGDTGGNTGGGSTGGGNSGGGDTGGGNNGGGDGSGNGDGNGSGDGGGSSGGSGNGSGNGEGDDEEEGGSGPGFCDGDECGFVAPSYFGGAEKIPGFDESFKRVYDGVLNSPIGIAVTGIAFPSGGGVCPSGSVELFGRDIVFDGHCNLWPQISGIFTALMIAVWSLLAVRIVLSS